MLLCRLPQQISQDTGVFEANTVCAGDTPAAARLAPPEGGQVVSTRQEHGVVAGEG